ncbi:MAG: DUF1887 family protein [Algicola sp.]|nr:DUF1887 family protein [Algicola sp.]
MSNILVSLVSDQTIPNIEFIKEMEETIDQFLFISTDSMEKAGNRQWILDTVDLNKEKVLTPIIVNAFSFEDIEKKLIKAINDDDNYIVNLTGGTKVMSLAVYEFFKTVNSEMFYLTGRGEKIKIHPGRKKVSSTLKSKISLSEYLTAYGFRVKNQSSPLRPKEATERLLSYFLHEFDREKDVPVLDTLRAHRSKTMKDIKENKNLISFITRTGFKPKNENSLNKYECRYLSGEWLEEYLYYFLIEHFDLAESSIGLGLHVSKSNTQNEFDVILIKNNKIYVFECKTSIYLDSEESQTFIGETIYKSDSLRNKLGLFAQTTVVTLSDLTNSKLDLHLSRADASRVKLIGRSAFANRVLLEKLKKI